MERKSCTFKSSNEFVEQLSRLIVHMRQRQPNPLFIVVMDGMPAAGKSVLSENLTNYIPQHYPEVEVVNYEMDWRLNDRSDREAYLEETANGQKEIYIGDHQKFRPVWLGNIVINKDLKKSKS